VATALLTFVGLLVHRQRSASEEAKKKMVVHTFHSIASSPSNAYDVNTNANAPSPLPSPTCSPLPSPCESPLGWSQLPLPSPTELQHASSSSMAVGAPHVGHGFMTLNIGGDLPVNIHESDDDEEMMRAALSRSSSNDALNGSSAAASASAAGAGVHHRSTAILHHFKQAPPSSPL
jgi:hypothetical protein